MRLLQLNEALRDTYEYLQKMAVGLEQVAWDQREKSGDFIDNFKQVEYKLRAVSVRFRFIFLKLYSVIQVPTM